MKIRDGFVSNSSSSSFIIALSTVPKTEEELRTLMFPHGCKNTTVSVSWGDTVISQEKAAELVFNNWKRISYKEVKDNFDSGSIEDADIPYPELSWHIPANAPEGKFEKLCEKNGKLVEEYHNKCFHKFMETLNKNTKFFTVEFCDNDGDIEATMEHGNAFDNLKFIRISHH